jgi:hypothetical protein
VCQSDISIPVFLDSYAVFGKVCWSAYGNGSWPARRGACVSLNLGETSYQDMGTKNHIIFSTLRHILAHAGFAGLKSAFKWIKVD